MAVLRIVADLDSPKPTETARWYAELFGLEAMMDLGWIVTLGPGGREGVRAPVQLSIAGEGGSGTPVPHLSIEVDNLDEIHAKAIAENAEITYPVTTEPWGVRRFFIRDPEGRILNILSHTDV
ncbi:MAG: VOC family protein [Pseudomonadota bacterium]